MSKCLGETVSLNVEIKPESYLRNTCLRARGRHPLRRGVPTTEIVDHNSQCGDWLYRQENRHIHDCLFKAQPTVYRRLLNLEIQSWLAHQTKGVT